MHTHEDFMLDNVVLIRPHSSQYGALFHFTEKLYEAWLRAGYNARYFTDVDEALTSMLRDPPDLMIGFNGIPRKDKRYYCDIVKRPYLSLLVDPFYRFFDVTSSPYAIIGCDDFSGYGALKRMNYQNVVFVPHAVESDLAPDSHIERIYDVTLLATFIDHESRRKGWRSTYPELICKAMEEAVEKTFADPLLPFSEEVLSQMRSLYEEHPHLKSSPIDIVGILSDVEIYIKGKERVDLLKAIQAAPVHVFGHTTDKIDWKKYFEKQSNIIVHDLVPYEKSLEIMKQSKIVLNSSIKNKFGAHERIFAGLAAGALVLTNENSYLQQFFTHDIDIAFYQFNHLNQINEMIHIYLSDDEKRQDMIENGREIVQSCHTWDARIQGFKNDLFPLVEKIRANS